MKNKIIYFVNYVLLVVGAFLLFFVVFDDEEISAGTVRHALFVAIFSFILYPVIARILHKFKRKKP